MGVGKEQALEAKRRKAVAAGKARYAGMGGVLQGKQVSWGDVSPQVVASAVDALTSVGDAVMFGLTSDATAYVVQLFTEGERPRWYPATPEACEELLGMLADAARAAQ